jgi:hypothetical protein
MRSKIFTTDCNYICVAYTYWFLHHFPYSKVVIAVPNQQHSDSLMDLFKKEFKSPHFCMNKNSIYHGNAVEGWFAIVLVADENCPERFVGFCAEKMLFISIGKVPKMIIEIMEATNPTDWLDIIDI